MKQRRLIQVHGIVQGVGFRPFVFALANDLGLRGVVRNDASGLMLDLEGDSIAIDRLVDSIRGDAPPLASVESVTSVTAPMVSHAALAIATSADAGERTALVSPDAATCERCLAELVDPANRRHGHPFISCTQCGPRLTITNAVPFDRERTTMARFPMCADCAREYADPANRRFHAETIACWQCGPSLAFFETAAVAAINGGVASERQPPLRAEGPAAIQAAATALARGDIVAVKGLGGYHLACDATSVAAVHRLRVRKHREAKPLAIMVRDLDAARVRCDVSDAEAALLSGVERPIVLLNKRRATVALEAIAPGTRRLGVMLPYTPVHHLLLAAAGRPLVMTSGNRADEPIAVDDDDAVERLGSIADAFLAHDRPITIRCDDSVALVTRGVPAFIRRSRGVAPRSLRLVRPVPVPVIAVGGHLKNTFCVAKGARAFLSHHVGHLESAGACRELADGIAHYQDLFDVEPLVIAHDLHPEYHSSRLALELERQYGAERVAVQHHHAHVVSCLAEHGRRGPAIGVVFDGAGLGADGAIWGGEFLVADEADYRRMAHLAYVGLPGGDRAAREPWRMAAAHLWNSYGPSTRDMRLPCSEAAGAERWSLVAQMLDRDVRCPPTSSMGRLFDAVAALLGIRHVAQYEGQAATELEMIADASECGSYAAALVETADGWMVDTRPLIRGIVEDVGAGCGTARIASMFHNAVRDFTAETAERIRARTGLGLVVLSGGVFQNVLLTQRVTDALERRRFEVLTHRLVPCNDGGLALGQVVVAARTCAAARREPSAVLASCA